MNENEYVQTPQNDLAQLQQVASEYCSEPAKGLAHGIQKDAIQNGTGARLIKDEKKAYRNWKFKFELIKINNKYALSFWDEGTTGLIGNILNNEEIQQWSAQGKLTSKQNLGRFLSRFDSGGGFGPGCFGRGKLIFQAGSKNYEILCDSLRRNDKEYIAFNRLINEDNLLVQMRVPLIGDEAKIFIEAKTGGVLKPLDVPGTRITILNLRDEIVTSFKTSFNEGKKEDDWDIFSKMISETWWEIIKFGAKIFLKFNDKVIKVDLYEPLKSIIESTDKVNNWRVHKRRDIPVYVKGERYKIKELKFALSPESIYEDFHDFWIQRRRMKIGSIKKNILPHHQIQKRIAAYILLDPALEDIIINSEGLTHYGFNLGGSGIRQIRDVVRTELIKFENKLGLQQTNKHKSVHIEMVDAMSEINKIAKDLGLLTEIGEGSKIKPVEILIKSFILPNKGSKRINDNQDVGPIKLEIRNNTNEDKKIRLFVFAFQKKYNNRLDINQQEFDIKRDQLEEVEIPIFQFTNKKLEYAQGVMLYFKADCRNTGDTLGQVTRMVWYGIDEPIIENNIIITVYKPVFPRDKSRRVELTEHIRDIRFKITNNSAENIGINTDLIIRKAKTESSTPIKLLELQSERNLIIESMKDHYINISSVEISNEIFGEISRGPAVAEERKCEIYFSVRVSHNIPKLKLIKGEKIGKKSILFFINIDPPGTSIFKNAVDEENPDEPRRSRHYGTAAEGYTFVLNIAHPSYLIASDNGIKKEYIMEEMLKQAYALAIKENIFRGPAEEYKDILAREGISPAESFLTVEAIIGKALLTMR